MDAQVRKRMKQDITWWKKTGEEDGDGIWAAPEVLKGFSVPDYKIVKKRDGTEVQVNTTIIMDAKYQDMIHDGDEVETDFISRTPVQAVIPYLSLKSGYELIQVMI